MANELLESPRGAMLLSLAFFAVTGVLASQRAYLHDEGIFTYEMARGARHAFAAFFFFVKTKPLLLLLYAVPCWLGLETFLVAHAAFGSLGVWLTCGVARRLGVPQPNLAGWVLALSLGYTVSTASGFANSDGATLLALMLYLYVSRHYVAASIVLGMLPFARNELGLLAIAFVLFDLARRRDWRFVAGAAVFPIGYVLAGALYHDHLLWLFRHFPDPAGKPRDIAGYVVPSWLDAFRSVGRSFEVNLGPLGLLAIFAWRARDVRTRFFVLLSWGTLAVMTVCQIYDIFGFDTSIRYHVALLPLFALLVPVAASSMSPGPWLGAALLALLLLVLPSTRSPLLVAVVLAALWRLRASPRAPTLLLIGAASLWWMVELVRNPYGREQHREHHRLVDELVARGLYHRQPLLSDVHIGRHDRCAGVHGATTLANHSIRWELERFLNQDNGQYRAIVAALGAERHEIEPEHHRVRRDGIYLLRDGARTRHWRERLLAERPQVERLGELWIYYWPRATIIEEAGD